MSDLYNRCMKYSYLTKLDNSIYNISYQINELDDDIHISLVIRNYDNNDSELSTSLSILIIYNKLSKLYSIRLSTCYSNDSNDNDIKLDNLTLNDIKLNEILSILELPEINSEYLIDILDN